MIRRALTSGLVAIACAAALAQEIKVQSFPDTSSILIGDQIRFTVTATIPGNINATLSSKSDTLAGKIVILKRFDRDTSTADEGFITVTDRYLITSFDSGLYTIPPFYAEFYSGDSIRRYFSDYSYLNVSRPDVTPPDTTDVIFDIVPPRNAPVTFREMLPYIVIAVIAAIIIYLLARFLPRNPLRKFVRPPAPREPAHVIAMRELAMLKTEELWQKGEVKEYYSRLSDIIRRYLDNRYGISSPELTTDETIKMLHKAAVTTHDQMTLVKNLLTLSDMVKFAKYIPHAELNEISFDDASRFVEMTREPDLTAEESMEKGGKNA